VTKKLSKCFDLEVESARIRERNKIGVELKKNKLAHC
jgi:hypothetical protein